MYRTFNAIYSFFCTLGIRNHLGKCNAQKEIDDPILISSNTRCTTSSLNAVYMHWKISSFDELFLKNDFYFIFNGYKLSTLYITSDQKSY